MPNNTIYFQNKNNTPELKTICSHILYKDKITIKEAIKHPLYHTIPTLNTITIIPLFNCINILSDNKNDMQNEDHTAIFCEYNINTTLYFNYYEMEVLI